MNKVFEKILERLILESSSCKVYKLINPNKEDIAEFNTYKKCIEIVKEVSEEYNGGWIPCSERLPEESLNSVIGWDAYRDRCVFAQYIQGKFQNMGKDDSFDIKAWMPLPEPFKERD